MAAEEAEVITETSELVELAWVDFAEARALDLPRITGIVLDDLELQVKAGFAPHLSVPFYFERHGRNQRRLL